jgi:hypothetical protein
MAEGNRGFLPFPVELPQRIHFMPRWFILSHKAMEEALHDMPLFSVACMGGYAQLPQECGPLTLEYVLEKLKLRVRFLVTVNLLLGCKGLMQCNDSPISAKNASDECAPEMHQSKNSHQRFFAMKVHIGLEADSGLAYTGHGKTDADKVERINASIRAKMEPLFRVINRQFDHVAMRYRSTPAQVHGAVANVWARVWHECVKEFGISVKRAQNDKKKRVRSVTRLVVGELKHSWFSVLYPYNLRGVINESNKARRQNGCAESCRVSR